MALSAAEAAKTCRAKLIASVQSIWTEQWGLAPNAKTPRAKGERVAIVLSGGVDTCAVVEALRENGFVVDLALTVYCDPSATDRPYAPLIAKSYGVDHVEIECGKDELLQGPLQLCVEALRSFDPMQIRNSMVVARALMEAKERGMRYVLTGDGSDELMGGYSFSWATEDPLWTQKRGEMCSDWFFSAPVLGEALGLKVTSPFTAPIFADWALSSLDKALCIGKRDLEAAPGEARQHRQTGKLPLREAFPEAISAWRRKDPIEVGSGATVLGKEEGRYFSDLINAEELLQEKQRLLREDKVVIRNPEHLYYYRVFRQALLPYLWSMAGTSQVNKLGSRYWSS
ncbi:Asparagine synthetase glutamine-hydrolyzing [Hondaea fermentalgiana]|uniref:Asparagine synthetase glutamine-hydrolyzing n=1 Tax=Hondaea fermentalgiana TaxID=2315210 RepID=A0A2R5GUE3_9STRA|nr:Asparagine synthetase glutamine-hydrolyzing [Hondaea fermentalgiana]|eukprot:GBG34482.1 Asparagine synthetase glutamine-hydrolyzing [Hondaea fermentalgiana]